MNQNKKFLLCIILGLSIVHSVFCEWDDEEFCIIIRQSVELESITPFVIYLSDKDVDRPSRQGSYFLHVVASFDFKGFDKRKYEDILGRMVNYIINISVIPRDGMRHGIALVSPKDRNENTPLYYAISKEHLPVAKELLKKIVYLDTSLVEFARQKHLRVYRACFRRFHYRL